MFLASSCSGRLGALGWRSTPFARQPIMVGLLGGIEPLTFWHRKIPQAPGVCSLSPLPGSAGSPRRPGPFHWRGCWRPGPRCWGAPGYWGAVVSRASQWTVRAHPQASRMEHLSPGDADRELTPAPPALTRHQVDRSGTTPAPAPPHPTGGTLAPGTDCVAPLWSALAGF